MKYEEMILWAVLAITWVEYLWELYLSLRQHKVYSTDIKVPKELEKTISPEVYEKSRLYGIDKSKFSIFKDFYSVVLSTVMIKMLLIYHVWTWGGQLVDYFNLESGELKQSAAFVFIMNTISTLMSLPISIYNTFVLEEKHGFNNQTCGFFIKDKLKSFALSQFIVVPLTCTAIYIVKVGGDYFFLYLWLFTVSFTLFFMTIYPEYIAPLFDKYTPLPDGKLRTSIEQLAASINFPLYKLYLVEGSKRSAHSNAYFYGFFKNKRIVLFDTLVQGYTPDDKNKSNEKQAGGDADSNAEPKGCTDNEVLAVLAHELGHWYFNHVSKNIIIMQVNLLLQFGAFGMLFKYPSLYRAFGFTDEQPIVIGLIIILMYVFSPYNSILSFMLTALSRKFEFQADQFAKGLHKAEHLGAALIKLHKDNLSFPVYDWLYSTWHHSHPTLLQRLAALKKKSD